MAPRAEAFKRIRQRLRRSLRYGSSRMNCLTIQLSELVVNYFDRNCNYDWLDADFAARLSSEGCLNPCTLVAVMIYIERLRRNNPTAYQQFNPNELYLSSLIVATKFLNDCGLDEFVWHDEWADVACVSMERLKTLELRFLDNIGWDLMITLDQFDNALRSVERGIAIHSSQTTGFFSYTDIHVLAEDLKPYMDHVQRFLVMCITVASVYIALWAVSWGCFVSISNTLQLMRNEDNSNRVTFHPYVITQFDSECRKIGQKINHTGFLTAIADVLRHELEFTPKTESERYPFALQTEKRRLLSTKPHSNTASTSDLCIPQKFHRQFDEAALPALTIK